MVALRAICYAGALTVALFSSGFLVLLTPLPVCVLIARGQRRAAGGTILVTVLFLATLYTWCLPRLLTGSSPWVWIGRLVPLPGTGFGALLGLAWARIFAAGYLAYFLLLGWCIGEAFRRRWSGLRMVGLGTIGATAVMFLTVFGMEWGAQWPVLAGFAAYLHQVVDQAIQMMMQSGVPGEGVALLRESADEVVRQALRLLPAFGWITSLFASTMTILCGRWVLRFYGINGVTQPFAQWRAPFGVVWVVIGSGVAFFADRYIVAAPWLAAAGLNGLVATAAVYFLQGVAVTQWMARRMPVVWRWVLYVMIVMWIQVAGIALTVLGLTDVWIDVRKRFGRAGGPNQRAPRA